MPCWSAGANEVANDAMMEAIIKGHQEVTEDRAAFIAGGSQAEIGKPKFELRPSKEPDHEMFEAVKDYADGRPCEVALDTDDKNVRDERLQPVYEEVHASTLTHDVPRPGEARIDECLYKTAEVCGAPLAAR